MFDNSTYCHFEAESHWDNYDIFSPNEFYKMLNDDERSSWDAEWYYSITQLNKENPFEMVDLHLELLEMANLQQLEITTSADCKILELSLTLNDEIAQFLDSLSPKNALLSQPIANAIVKRIEAIASFIDTEAKPLINIRARHELSSDDGALIWHIDPDYSSERGKNNGYHFTFVLKGPSTLFYNPSPEITQAIQKEILDEGKGKFYESTGVTIPNKFIDSTKVISANFGQGAIFKTGPYSNGAIHAVPEFSRARLFIGVFFSTCETGVCN